MCFNAAIKYPNQGKKTICSIVQCNFPLSSHRDSKWDELHLLRTDLLIFFFRSNFCNTSLLHMNSCFWIISSIFAAPKMPLTFLFMLTNEKNNSSHDLFGTVFRRHHREHLPSLSWNPRNLKKFCSWLLIRSRLWSDALSQLPHQVCGKAVAAIVWPANLIWKQVPKLDVTKKHSWAHPSQGTALAPFPRMSPSASLYFLLANCVNVVLSLNRES